MSELKNPAPHDKSRLTSPFASRLRGIAHAVTGVIYTPLCPLCQTVIDAATPHNLCADCWQGLPFTPRHHCKICSQPLPTMTETAEESTDPLEATATATEPSHNMAETATATEPSPEEICFTCQQRPIAVDKIVAPFLYDEPISQLILRLKYADDLALSKFFAQHLLTALSTMTGGDNPTDYLLLPVPSHFSRTIKRKYNQAEVLAKSLSRLTAIPMVGNLLQRIEPTSQKHIGADARYRQLKNAFALNEKIWQQHRHKKIILVDDVVTTCATMHHLAILLKRNKAGFVGGVAIARTHFQ